MHLSFSTENLGESLELVRDPREATALVSTYIALSALRTMERAIEALVKQKAVRLFQGCA
jgi:hypothetical protein